MQASLLYERTGTEVLIMAVRSDSDDYLSPYTFTTGDRIDDFFKLIFDTTITRISGKLESYCLAGIQGTSHCYSTRTIKR